MAKTDHFAEVQELLGLHTERTRDDELMLWGYIYALHEAGLVTIDQWQTLRESLDLTTEDITDSVLWNI